MFNRRFIPYIIAGSIIAFLSISYVGYKAYQNHVDFNELISEAEIFERSLDKDTSSLEHKEGRSPFPTTNSTSSENLSDRFPYLNKPPIKVRYDDPSMPALKLEDIPPEHRFRPKPDELELVIQRVETPDGKIHEMLVARGMEIPEGASLPPSFFNRTIPQLPPRKKITTAMEVRKEDIPEGEDITTYMDKLRIASDYGVSVEEAERMLTSGQIRITEVDRFPLTNQAGLGMEEASSESFRGEAGLDGAPMPPGHHGEDAASAGTGSFEDFPARSDSPPSPLNPPDMVESTPSPQSVADIEKQLTPAGIEAEFSESLSPERFNKAQELIEQYGTEEGLRRLREMDPEAARQFEQGRRPAPSRDVPDGEQSESKD